MDASATASSSLARGAPEATAMACTSPARSGLMPKKISRAFAQKPPVDICSNPAMCAGDSSCCT